MTSSTFLDRNLSTQNIAVLRKDGGNICINKNINQNIIPMRYVKLEIPLLLKRFYGNNGLIILFIIIFKRSLLNIA